MSKAAVWYIEKRAKRRSDEALYTVLKSVREKSKLTQTLTRAANALTRVALTCCKIVRRTTRLKFSADVSWVSFNWTWTVAPPRGHYGNRLVVKCGVRINSVGQSAQVNVAAIPAI